MDQIFSTLQNNGLGDICDALKQKAKRSIFISLFKQNDPNKLFACQSYFGGVPTVPKDFVWPTNGGGLLNFIGQLALSNMNWPDEDFVLPNSGNLYFFYDVDRQPWGLRPEDSQGFKVIYCGDEFKECVPADKLEYEVDYNMAFTAKFSLEMQYPFWSDEIQDMLRDENHEHYDVLLEKLENADAACHHMLGYPDVIQKDMEGELVRMAQRTFGVTSKKNDWVLLLQVDSDPRLDWEWGDSGCLYFWIRRQDLAIKNFANIWVFLQCY